ncbi:glycosyltransferase family 4 protein [Lutibacter sp.]
MKRKSILHVAYALYSTDARIKSYIYTLKKYRVSYKIWALDENDTSNENVIALAKKYQGNSIIAYLLSYIKFFFRVFFKAIFSIGKFRVVHYHNMPNFIVFAFWPLKLTGTKIILDNHDIMPVTFLAKFENPPIFLRWILYVEQYLSAQFADLIITADDEQKDFLVNLGIESSKIKVFLNVPNPLLFSKNIKEKNTLLLKRIKANDFVLIYHGTIVQRLGIDILLKAISKARIHIPNLKFLLIGNGDYLSEIRRLIETLSLQDTVILSEKFVPVEELPIYFQKAHVGIIGNRKNTLTDRFMLPVKLLEYVYWQIPVIAPNLKIIRRYFDDTMICYYEPENVDDLSEAIQKLYRSAELRKQLAHNAKGFYQKINWENQEKKYMEILHQWKI